MVMEVINKKKILLIGPMPLDGEALGGAKTAFLKTVESLTNSDRYCLDVISTSRRISNSARLLRSLKNLTAFLKTFFLFILRLKKNDIVILNMSSGSVFLASWPYVVIAKLLSKKVVLRIFGGGAYQQFCQLKGLRKKIAESVLKNIDLLALETKFLCKKFHVAKAVHWLPNSRDMPAILKERKEVKTILFLSHVRKDKGVYELLMASEQLPDDVYIKIYGSVSFGIPADYFSGYRNVKYMGVAGADEVPSILSDADLVVLPTYYHGEGYPGIIIEAFQSGIPVVATNWKAIPEIVDDEINGLLVEPRNHQKLSKAILRFVNDSDFYRKRSKQAFNKGEYFRCSNVYCDFEDKLDSI